MKITIIAAISENRVIGKAGALPWHLPEDLRRFRRLTEGHAVVMGRKTFESIGRPLPKRRNIILSREPDFQVEGAEVFGALDEAIDELACGGEQEVFIIGGGEIYRQALPLADRIELTMLPQAVEGDTFFPPIPGELFVQTDRRSVEGAIPYSFITYQRR